MFKFFLFIIYIIAVVAAPVLFNRLGKSRYYINGDGIPSALCSHKEEDNEVYFLALMSELIRVNNDINQHQINFVHTQHLHQFDDVKRTRLISIFSALLSRKQHVSTYTICSKLKKQCPYAQRLQMVDFLMLLATVDNNYTTSESNWVLQYADALGIQQQDYNPLYFRHIYGKFEGHRGQRNHGQRTSQQQSYRHAPATPRQPYRSAYSILGLSPSATDDEVRSAYRRLAKQYHPDHVTDADPRAKEESINRFRQITQAYHQIRRARRMK